MNIYWGWGEEDFTKTTWTRLKLPLLKEHGDLWLER